MTAPTTTPSDNDFYAFLARFHGHRCPMSVLGARLGLAARARVGRHGADGDVKAVYFHRTCALDGIACALGTTMGNQNLESRPEGAHRLLAENKTDGRMALLELTERALARGKRYGDLRRAGDASGEREAILLELENAPEADLVAELEG